MSLAVGSVVIIMKPPIVPGGQIVGTARRDVSRKTRETRGEARGAVRRGGAEKERRACPTRFNLFLFFPCLGERKQKRPRRLSDRYLDHEALDLTYVFSVLAIFVGFASLYILL